MSVQGGGRPVLIAQNDVGNLHSPTVEIIPMTSQFKAMHLPTHVPVPATAGNGLEKDSVVLAEQTTTINKSQLSYRLGQLSTDSMKRIGDARRVQSPFP